MSIMNRTHSSTETRSMTSLAAEIHIMMRSVLEISQRKQRQEWSGIQSMGMTQSISIIIIMHNTNDEVRLWFCWLCENFSRNFPTTDFVEFGRSQRGLASSRSVSRKGEVLSKSRSWHLCPKDRREAMVQPAHQRQLATIAQHRGAKKNTYYCYYYYYYYYYYYFFLHS